MDLDKVILITHYSHGQNRFEEGKHNCICCQKILRYWGAKHKKRKAKKDNYQNFTPPACLSSPGSAGFLLNRILLTALPAFGSIGEWNTEGTGQYVTVPLCWSFFLTLFPCFSMRSLPWDTIFQNKIASVWTLHRLQILQEMPACSTVESFMACSMDICSSLWTTEKHLLWHLQYLLHLLLWSLCSPFLTEFFSFLLCLGGFFSLS